MKRILLFFGFLSIFCSTKAAHIVGGEMTYTWVSGNTYQVTLCVYRDGNGGGADFDGTPGAADAIIVLYNDQTNMVFNSIDIGAPTTPTVIVQPPTVNPCLTPPNVLIEQRCYTFNITLPNSTTFGLDHDPFYVIYGRCCRNAAIDNLLNPSNQGALYYAFIPAKNNGQPGNNSPTFNNDPPLFVCRDRDLIYDHSATDVDGDSLVYKMCAPLQSLSSSQPAFNGFGAPPSSMLPPFDSIVWLTPTYHTGDMLGGSIPLTIDNLGTIRATPDANGPHVVGICVEEWRGGVKISETLRDFQYFVATCNDPYIAVSTEGTDPITGFEIYITNCDGFTVDFIHSSISNPPPTSIPLQYWWDFGDGSPSSSLASPTHTYADTGSYIVRTVAFKDDGTGTICYSDTVTRVVNIYPFLEADFEFIDSCQNMAAEFFDSSTYANGLITGWDWDFGQPGPGDESTAQNPTFMYNNPGTYNVSLQITTNKGCTEDTVKTVTIYPVPVPDFDASEGCVFDVKSANNTSTISSGSIVSYHWDFDNGTTSTLMNPNLYYTVPGAYNVTLTVTSDLGCVASITKTVVVRPLPNPTVTPTNDIICPGTSIQLIATGGTQFFWTPDDTTINNNLSPIPVVTPVVPTTYTVEVGITYTDPLTGLPYVCSDFASAFIDLHPPAIANAGEDTSICLANQPSDCVVGGVIAFNDTVQLFGSGGITYAWTPNQWIEDTSVANPVVYPDSNRTYVLTIADVNGCVDTDSVNVFVLNPAFDLIEFGLDSLCGGDTITIVPIDLGTITDYKWTDTVGTPTPDYMVNDTVKDAVVYPPAPHTYILEICNYCYTKKDTVHVDVLPKPFVDAGPIDSICVGGDSVQLNSSPLNLELYQWTTSDPSISDASISNPMVQPPVTSTYHLLGVDSFGTIGCSNEDSTTVFVYPLPDLTITPPPDFFCLGTPGRLNAISTTGVRYEWTGPPTISGGTTANPLVTPADTATYYVTTYNGHGCAQNDSVTVNIMHPVTAVVYADTNICLGESVQLTASGGDTYWWLPTSAINNPAQPNPYVYPDSSATYHVIVSNDCFSDTTKVYVEVNRLPLIEAGYDITILRDEIGQLNGEATGDFLWYVGEDGSFEGILDNPYVSNPQVSPLSTTEYVLRTQDPYTGCYNHDTLTVYVDVFTLLAIPTGFSPDGDGVNDVFHIIKWLNIDELLNFEVYNRWGEKLYESKDLETHGWDGTYKGRDSEIGTYVWRVKARTKDNEIIYREGNITLVR